MSNQPTLWGFNENETGGQVRSTDPATSQRAAMNVRVGSYHAMIILMLADGSPEGMTARALADASASSERRLTPEKANTRLKELHDRGLVEFMRDPNTQAPLEAPTTPGNTGRVHVLSYYGQQVAVHLKLDRDIFEWKE